MEDSDSDLDLGNSEDEEDEEDYDSEDKEDVDNLEETDELSKKNLIKSESCNLYTIPEEEEKGSKDSKNDSYISRLELYFKQLAECSNK